MVFHLIFLFIATIGSANITEIFHLQEIERELQNIDEKTLVVFDVDEVLIMTKDHFIHPYAIHVVDRVAQRELANHSKSAIDELISLCFLLPERILIEESTPSLIKRLQGQNIKTIALTSCQTGTLGLIRSVENWRVEDLKSFDIDFSSSFPEYERLVFDELKSPSHPSPLFESGVLFSKGYQKGKVLKAFLDRIDFVPSKILFIDDLSHNLLSVKDEFQLEGIPYHLFYYTGASRYFKKLNEALIEYQLIHLIHHKEWLSDDEIQKTTRSP